MSYNAYGFFRSKNGFTKLHDLTLTAVNTYGGALALEGDQSEREDIVWKTQEIYKSLLINLYMGDQLLHLAQLLEVVEIEADTAIAIEIAEDNEKVDMAFESVPVNATHVHYIRFGQSPMTFLYESIEAVYLVSVGIPDLMVGYTGYYALEGGFTWEKTLDIVENDNYSCSTIDPENKRLVKVDSENVTEGQTEGEVKLICTFEDQAHWVLQLGASSSSSSSSALLSLLGLFAIMIQILH
jgi:hypothetical protein